MKPTKEELAAQLTIEDFPRSNSYDPEWMLKNMMGPNVVWLTEALTQVTQLQAGTRVMDLGCGKAMSSVFMAREFQLEVWATDLWISASENWQRIREAGMQQRVFPIHAEAHALPFAHDFFDALICVDAYHYFGTDDLYLEYITQFVRPGGTLAIIVPGVIQEFDGAVPAHLSTYWRWDWHSFHSPAWWRYHWEKMGLVEVTYADTLPNGWKHWLRWLEICQRAGFPYPEGYPSPQDEIEMLRVDAGRTLGFTRLVARKKYSQSFNTDVLYLI